MAISVTIWQEDRGEAFLVRIIVTSKDPVTTSYHAFASLGRALDCADGFLGFIPEEVKDGLGKATWHGVKA